jgi:hypothetical protein
MKNTAFCDVARCSSCVNRRFGGTCRLHLQGRKSASEESAWASSCRLRCQDGRESGPHRKYPPRHAPIPALACYLLPNLNDVSPPLSLLISHVAHSPSLPLCPYIAGCFRLVAQSAATCSRWFLARRFFYPEDWNDTFLRNISCTISQKNHFSFKFFVNAVFTFYSRF